ncbi:MAG: MFS transporter [Desulfomonilaceae bacterium]|jgi:MFS family permease
MLEFVTNTRFLVLAASNFFLFLVVSAWSFLSIFVSELGANTGDIGVLMASAGITSLGVLPFIAPLIDRYGRKGFMVVGIFVVGISNLAFMLFHYYSPWMLIIRLIQGLAFAACFNACSTALVDLLPFNKRVQGIGLYGISGSLAVAVGPYLGETVIIHFGFNAYFALLATFGIVGACLGLAFKEPFICIQSRVSKVRFFPTVIQGKHVAMMSLVAVFGSGFAAMNTFFPLYAKSLGIRAGIFFTSYGATLIIVRLVLGNVVDRMNRDRLILVCLLGFGALLVATSQIQSMIQTIYLGILFGATQGLSYPAMMARMVDKSNDANRAIVVSLFTGSFGVGINLSVLLWGFIGKINGLPFMFAFGGSLMFVTALICIIAFFLHKESVVGKRATSGKPG